MPAHALRAADHLKALSAPASERRDVIAEAAAKRFETVDLSKQYDPREAWTAQSLSEGFEFTSTACGVRLRAHGEWTVNQLALSKGSCVVYFSTGPYKATKHRLRPSVMLLVQRAKDGESLQEYAGKLIKDGSIDKGGSVPCPVERCLSFKASEPGMYGKDGDGKGRLVAFERDEPAFPGLALEAPHDAPKPDAKEGMQYYRPVQTQHRIPGKLYYVVLLDAASSIEQPAMGDFEFFLKNLTVE